jgi:DSHCT (NUC185) domain
VQLVKMKGRVACEIGTCECLIASEAIFEGVFAELAPAEAAALLCALVNQHKLRPAEGGDRDAGAGYGGPEAKLVSQLGDVPATLKDAVGNLAVLTLRLGHLQVEKGALNMDPVDYLQVSVRPSLTAVRACRLRDAFCARLLSSPRAPCAATLVLRALWPPLQTASCRLRVWLTCHAL